MREKANDKYCMLSATSNELRYMLITCLVLRVSFFQSQTPSSAMGFTEDEIHASIRQYLVRDEDILDDLKAERRVGRPPSTKQTLLEQIQGQEAKEYEAGFWLPELRDRDNLDKLAKWSGHWAGLGQLAFMRVEKVGIIKDSAFPPTGAA